MYLTLAHEYCFLIIQPAESLHRRIEPPPATFVFGGLQPLKKCYVVLIIGSVPDRIRRAVRMSSLRVLKDICQGHAASENFIRALRGLYKYDRGMLKISLCSHLCSISAVSPGVPTCFWLGLQVRHINLQSLYKGRYISTLRRVPTSVSSCRA
jgi:hypothetical protein